MNKKWLRFLESGQTPREYIHRLGNQSLRLYSEHNEGGRGVMFGVLLNDYNELLEEVMNELNNNGKE